MKQLLINSSNEIKSLRKKVSEYEKQQHTPIAIVGIGCRFPGGNDSPDSYWQYLLNGNCSVSAITNTRWSFSANTKSDNSVLSDIYSNHMSLLDQIDQFDAELFNLPTAEVELMDPQQRLLLMVCQEALHNAGYHNSVLRGSKTGVFIGASSNDYARLTMNAELQNNIDGYACLGSTPSVIAGRISYLMDFNGPAITLDSSCSSSLLSVHYACESIRRGESQVALAGGVNLILTPENTIALSKMQALSRKGLCRTFDENADGYVRGEGAGIVVLKTLAQAKADNDDIYAVIKGSAINHDGASNGLTAPNAEMQEQVIRDALKNSGVKSNDVHYVETHGTGTPLGDPIEINALASALRANQNDIPLVIGSVKTNIGHLESAAGIAALIKMALCSKYGKIPAHLHFNSPNPYIAWDQYNLNVPKKVETWQQNDASPNYGAVSAFGLSGTNVHVITSAYKNVESQTNDLEKQISSKLLLLSARSPEALVNTANRWSNFIQNSSASRELICKNSQHYQHHYNFRLAVEGSSKDELLLALNSVKINSLPAKTWQGQTDKKPVKLAMLFSGQGSQYVQMGRDLYKNDLVFSKAIDECQQLYKVISGNNLTDILWGNSTHNIDDTQYTQPAIFSIQYALLKFWQAKGIQPSAVIGHSIGEYAAAYAAGVMSLEDAMHLVIKRGQLMTQMCTSGSMLAINSSVDVVKDLLEKYVPNQQIAIAAVNSENNVVISGDSRAVDKLTNALAELNVKSAIKYTPLKVSHGFHSPLMEPMLDCFSLEVTKTSLHKPNIAFYSTLSGQKVTAELCDPEYWSKQISSPVEFYRALLALEEEGIDAFLEIGSGTTLTGLTCTTINLDDNASFYSLQKHQSETACITGMLAKMYCNGIVDAKLFNDKNEIQKLALPASAPVLKSYWCDYVPSYLANSSAESSIATAQHIIQANLCHK